MANAQRIPWQSYGILADDLSCIRNRGRQMDNYRICHFLSHITGANEEDIANIPKYLWRPLCQRKGAKRAKFGSRKGIAFKLLQGRRHANYNKNKKFVSKGNINIKGIPL